MADVIFSGVPAKKWDIRFGDGDALRFASSELGKYLLLITGERQEADGSHTIEIKIDKSLPKDGYNIKLSEKMLLIAGGNARGAIYGVYALLERLGVRFIMPGLEVYGEGGELPEGFSQSFAPPFEYRQSDWVCGNDIDWSVKNRINNRAIGEERGGYVKWGSFVHTMSSITGCAPDTQPCLSDPEVIKAAKRYARELLRKDPGISIISVSQNDNFNRCRCERCEAVEAEEGSPAGLMLRLVNAVADDIRGDYPNVAIETLAYQYTRRPPKITKPRPNVIVRLCSIECCFSHALSDGSCEKNAAFARDIRDWNKICDRLYIWDYVTDFSYYLPPFPNFGVLRENMRFFAEHGVKGMYPEGNYQAQSGEFGELRAYLLAKLMYDPMMSEREYQRHTDEFLQAYYGAGWRYIRAFIEFLCSEAKKNHLVIWSRPFTTLEKDAYIAMEATIDGWWDSAEREAGERLENVKRSRLSWTYVKLMLHPDAEAGAKLFADVNSAGIRWNEWHKLPAELLGTPDFNLPPDEWVKTINPE